jgi:hypothetical protein
VAIATANLVGIRRRIKDCGGDEENPNKQTPLITHDKAKQAQAIHLPRGSGKSRCIKEV